MRRRDLLRTGAGLLPPVVATTRGQETAVESVVADTHTETGLTTGLARAGDTVLFGFDDGNILVYDDTRDGTLIPLTVDRRVSHLEVRDGGTTAVIGWQDADVFGRLDLTTMDGALVELAGLWDLATTPEAARTAAVTQPAAGPGRVGVADSDGTMLWETSLGDATGQQVAIADDGRYVAVGAAHYWADGREPAGQPGVRLYDGDGVELWRHDHDEAVIAVGVDAARDRVVAGTDDGRTVVLDLAGDVVWETDAFGGWVVLADEGGTVVTAADDETLRAVDVATGATQWTAAIGMAPGEDISVAADGSRVLATDRAAAAFVLVDAGEVIWTDRHDGGPGRGAIAADGRTWSTIVTNHDAETARLHVYRTAAAIESEPAPDTGTPAADADDAAETEDDQSDEDDADDGDGTDDADDSDDETGAPVSIALVDHEIVGERASEESITLQNTGDAPLDLSGWRIEDDHRIPAGNASPFEFPRGFTLAAGATVTISTGGDAAPPETLSWGYDGRFQMWNEEGDVLYVYDERDRLRLEEPIVVESRPPDDEPADPDDPPADDPVEEDPAEAPDAPDDPEEDPSADPPDEESPEQPDDPSADDPVEAPEDPSAEEPREEPNDPPNGPDEEPPREEPPEDGPAGEDGSATDEQPVDEPPADEQLADPASDALEDSPSEPTSIG